MTPIGGIKPHKKFQVQANRAEVLFIDYILEHLKFNGRAAIIVPDSILYNESSSAYIELRKILVTNNLICIISLPSGIFKPYAKDIKTSILIIDRIKAKKTNEILHLSIKNDGFSLSDTRKPISKNDLPLCNKIVKSFILNSNSKFQIDTSDNNLNAFIFDKNKLAEKKYVLLTSKYLPEDLINSNYETKYLSELISEIKDKVGNKINIKPLSVSNKLGFTNSDELFNDTIYSSNLSNYKIVSKNNFAYNPSRINVGSIALLKDNIVGCVSPMYVVFKIKNENILNPDFLLLLLKDDYFKLIIEKTVYGAVRIQLKFNSLKNLKIPVPPIEKQLEILNKINLHKENISKFEILAKEIEKDINLLVKNTWIK
jgi:type I restriction enzyme M protein